jgi:hypothetical protein
MTQPCSTTSTTIRQTKRAQIVRRRLHLMADYGSTGLWDDHGRPLDPSKLPVSSELRERLARWSTQFQASFQTKINLRAFAAEGRAIARAMKSELPEWSIVYFDEEAAARADYQGPS